MNIPVSFDYSDQVAANRIAARRAHEDRMPTCAARHEAFALALENTRIWAAANCPAGYRPVFSLTMTFEPDINAHLLPQFRK